MDILRLFTLEEEKKQMIDLPVPRTVLTQNYSTLFCLESATFTELWWGLNLACGSHSPFLLQGFLSVLQQVLSS